MSHRDELESAHQRIRALENRIEELEEGKKPKPKATKDKGGSPKKALGCAFGGLSGFVLLVLGSVIFGIHACIACNSDISDPALEALRRCPAAREALGDDIDWSVVGCTSYSSKSGGDPINQGCHSSQRFQIPVSGTKGRGSYHFSATERPGQDNRFTGGVVYMRGSSILVRDDGMCMSSATE